MPRSWIAATWGPVLALALVVGCSGPDPGGAAAPVGAESTVAPDTTSSDGSTPHRSSAHGSSGQGSSADGTSAGGSAAGSSAGRSSAGASAAGSSADASPAVESGANTTPGVETSGAEKTGDTQTEQAVLTPRLPIGGDSPDSVDAQQCASVSFLGQGDNSIPPGVSIVGTEPVFLNSLFTSGGGGCAGASNPPCKGFTFTAENTGRCSIPVQTARTRPVGEEGPTDQLRLRGRLVCPAGQEDACARLAQGLERDDQFIELFLPEAPPPPTTESTSTSASASASAASSGSSSSSAGVTTESSTAVTTSSAGGT
jgi:hypothetical protein